MTKEEIFKKLIDIFKLVMGSNSKCESISLQTKIIEDLNLTSVAMVYIVFAIEKTFKITMSNVKYKDFNTVQDVVELIYSKLN